MATATVSKQIRTRLMVKTEQAIALVFTGASGHGKTKFAKLLGTLLEVAFLYVDCTEMEHETDLFGPQRPYVGCHAGSPLNNHLTLKMVSESMSS